MRGCREDARGRIKLDRLPAIHHHGAIRDLGDHAHVVGDEEDRHILLLLELFQQLQDLGLDGDVERGGRLVGDQELRLAGERHRDHHALAHAAGEAMRMLVEARFRGGDADAVEQAHGLGLRRRARQAAMLNQRFRDLEADGEHRIEARHRFLEDHGDIVAADVLHISFGQRQQIAASEHDAALATAALFGNEPHDRERGDALARTGFADDRDGFAGRDLEGDAANDRDPLPLAQE